MERKILEFKNPSVVVYSVRHKDDPRNDFSYEEKCILCDCSMTDMRTEGEVNGYWHYNCWHFVNQYAKNLQYTFVEACEQIKNRLFGIHISSF